MKIFLSQQDLRPFSGCLSLHRRRLGNCNIKSRASSFSSSSAILKLQLVSLPYFISVNVLILMLMLMLLRFTLRFLMLILMFMLICLCHKCEPAFSDTQVSIKPHRAKVFTLILLIFAQYFCNAANIHLLLKLCVFHFVPTSLRSDISRSQKNRE